MINLSNKTNNIPLITIGITCFNASDTIERALKSAFSQDWENYEVIVIDDCSTDNSKSILNKWKQEKNNLHIINHKTNKGCAKARNSIISLARGEFIAFFDDDDESRSDRLRLQYETLIRYEKSSSIKLVACFASGNRIYKNGYSMPFKSVGVNGLPPVGYEMVNYLLFFERIQGIGYGSGVPTCSLFARSDIFKEIGEFDSKMRRQEDVDFGIRLGIKGAHFIGIKEPVVTQYSTYSNDKTPLVEFESSILLIDKFKDHLNSKGLYNYMKNWIKIKYYHFIGNEYKALIMLLIIFIKYPKRTLKHFLYSASRRFIHEQLINSKPKNLNFRHKCVKFLNHII
tara:strand:+ start:9718 stop:10743 length:1026 start_codon:yes stop_codon:yes gene_type:complete